MRLRRCGGVGFFLDGGDPAGRLQRTVNAATGERSCAYSNHSGQSQERA